MIVLILKDKYYIITHEVYFMAYKDILSNMIKESGLSLKEISNRCETLGVSVVPSYISQLQTGKLPPPSEEISKALADVCSADPLHLILEGYFERAPQIIKDAFVMMGELNKRLLVVLPDNSDTIKKEMQESIKTNNLIVSLDSSMAHLQKAENYRKIKPFADAYNYIKTGIKEIFYENGDYHIFANADTMEPLIPKEAQIKFMPYNGKEPENNDIVLYEKPGNLSPNVRRYYKYQNIIILIPENRKYLLDFLTDPKEINVIGKVVSYRMKVK